METYFIVLKVCKINLKSDKIICNFQSTPTQAPFDPSKIWLSCEKKTWLLCQVYIAFKNMQHTQILSKSSIMPVSKQQIVTNSLI